MNKSASTAIFHEESIQSTVLKAVYIGETNPFSKSLLTVQGKHISFMHFNNAILALTCMKQINYSPEVVFCDVKLNGTDLLSIKQILTSEFGNSFLFIGVNDTAIKPESAKKFLLAGIDDVLDSNSELRLINLRLEYLHKKHNLKEVGQIEKQKLRIGFFKRAFDVIFSSLVLLALSPILLLVALLIKIDSKGPVFFISKRVGAGYRLFDFYKFRSMKQGADQLVDKMSKLNQYGTTSEESKIESCTICDLMGSPCSTLLYVDGKEICENRYRIIKNSGKASFLKVKDDPRVTKLGQFLRKTSIDELPQLINILKGDMSIVGNRPLPLYEAEQLTTDMWAERFNGPAGLTGLWQVTKRGKSDMSEAERKQLDNTYARNHSFWGDISIILKTIPALLQKENV